MSSNNSVEKGQPLSTRNFVIQINLVWIRWRKNKGPLGKRLMIMGLIKKRYPLLSFWDKLEFCRCVFFYLFPSLLSTGQRFWLWIVADSNGVWSSSRSS